MAALKHFWVDNWDNDCVHGTCGSASASQCFYSTRSENKPRAGSSGAPLNCGCELNVD